MKEIRSVLEDFKIKEMFVKSPMYDFDGNFKSIKENYEKVINILFNKINYKISLIKIFCK